jgi:hypothetical protein
VAVSDIDGILRGKYLHIDTFMGAAQPAPGGGFGFCDVVFGWDAGGRPPLSLGYVNVPGALLMAVLTTAVAPWGAKLAHALDRAVLRRAFAVWLLVTAAAVVWKAV